MLAFLFTALVDRGQGERGKHTIVDLSTLLDGSRSGEAGGSEGNGGTGEVHLGKKGECVMKEGMINYV